jgi:uncharacterized membrane protein
MPETMLTTANITSKSPHGNHVIWNAYDRIWETYSCHCDAVTTPNDSFLKILGIIIPTQNYP